MTEKYDELGGSAGDRWELPKTVPCPRCGVGAGRKCRNPITGLEAHSACEVRNKAAAAAITEGESDA
jgi:hypothetical protein